MGVFTQSLLFQIIYKTYKKSQKTDKKLQKWKLKFVEYVSVPTESRSRAEYRDNLNCTMYDYNSSDSERFESRENSTNTKRYKIVTATRRARNYVAKKLNIMLITSVTIFVILLLISITISVVTINSSFD